MQVRGRRVSVAMVAILAAIAGQVAAEVVLAETLKYVHERKAFGKPIAKFQNTQFKLAEVATEVEIGRALIIVVHRDRKKRRRCNQIDV